MKFLHLANLIITALTGTLLFIFVDITDKTVLLNILFLMLSLEIPSIYLLISKKSLQSNDNELSAPSLCVCLITCIIDIIFYSICIACHSENFKLFILFTTIFHSIIAAVLLILKSATDYIKKQH